jgi:MFS family permease
MSCYQALVFSTMYSLYASYATIWQSPPYNFSTTQVGLAYTGPAIGFIITAIIVVAFIDIVYESLAERKGTQGEPEYRLPLANIGAVFLPISLFWFGWAVEKKQPWPSPYAASMLFGACQVSIFNTVQTYFIDAFEHSAASAVAAGACLRAAVGGVAPLFVGQIFKKLGYGVGMSIFGALSMVLMPAPVLFQIYGRRVRERFVFKR